MVNILIYTIIELIVSERAFKGSGRHNAVRVAA